MERSACAFLVGLLPAMLLTACDADPVEAPPVTTRPGEPALPAGTVVPPGSELERRINGTCIPFDPWQDGSGRTTCVMTTPQDGTLGRLTSESEDELAGAEVAGAGGALLDAPPTTLPGAVDHRAEYLDGCVTVSHQRACGWCVAHAATALLEALHCSKGCDVPELSEAHLGSISRDGRDFGSCADGWSVSSAAGTLIYAPIAPAETWPFVANGRGLNQAKPSTADLDRTATYQPTGYSVVAPSDLEAVKGALASGREVMISIPTYQDNGVMPPRNDWRAAVANVREPPTERPCPCGRSGCTDGMCHGGYHAVVLTGYDDAAGEFTFLNSWGKGWGEAGYGRMSYGFVQKHVRTGITLDDVRGDLPGATCSDPMTPDAGMDGGIDGGLGDAGVPPPTDGGVTAPPGDPCAGNGDCASCTALSGCGWCEGVGCRDDSTESTCSDWHLSTCPTTPDPCVIAASTCRTCLETPGCQWCASGGICYDPTLRGIDCSDPRNAVDQCNECEATDCGSCAPLEGCGWCPRASSGVVAPGTTFGDCVSGSEIAADRASCASYRGTADSCIADECAGFEDCSDCLEVSGCGWCDVSDQCMVGGLFGPVSDRSYGNTCGLDWDYFTPWCDTTVSDCERATSCTECLGNESRGCFWGDDSNRCTEDLAALASETGLAVELSQCGGFCGDEGAECAEDCCDGLSCVIGYCADCTGKQLLTETCDPSIVSVCCGALTCSQATGGGSTCCLTADESCASDAECCGDMLCRDGDCWCREVGESCQSGRECCGSTICVGGTCV